MAGVYKSAFEYSASSVNTPDLIALIVTVMYYGTDLQEHGRGYILIGNIPEDAHILKGSFMLGNVLDLGPRTQQVLC